MSNHVIIVESRLSIQNLLHLILSSKTLLVYVIYTAWKQLFDRCIVRYGEPQLSSLNIQLQQFQFFFSEKEAGVMQIQTALIINILGIMLVNYRRFNKYSNVSLYSRRVWQLWTSTSSNWVAARRILRRHRQYHWM